MIKCLHSIEDIT